MSSAIDTKTGAVIEVPDSTLAEAYKSGAVKLLQGQRYAVRAPDGTIGHVAAEDASAALDAGADFIPKEVAKAQVNAEKYGGVRGMAEAAGSGAAGMATLGLSDELMPKGWNKDVQKAQQENPGSTMVGQGLGAILPAVATGGASAAEETGLGLAKAAGATSESLLGRIAQRGVANAARGAFEGAQYGVSQAVSDDAFSNHKQTAEQVLSTIGTNTLWGGALGGALGSLGGAFSHAPGEVVEHAATPEFGRATRSPTDADISGIAAKAIGVDTPAEGLGTKLRGWYSKLAGAASGKDPDQILKFTDLSNVAEADSVEATRDAAARDIRTHGDAVMAASKDVNEVWNRGMKRSFIAKSLEGVDADAAANRSRSLVDHVVTRLNDMLDHADEYGGTAPIENTLKVANEYSGKLDKAIASGDVAEMYGITDDLKKAIGKPTAKAARLSTFAQGDELLASQLGSRQQAWKDLHATLQAGLEDNGVWKQMGDAQAQVNKAYTGLIDSRQRFNSALTTDIGRDASDPWSKAYGIDPQKVGGYVRGLIQPEKDLTHQAVKDYLSNSKLLADTFAQHFDLPEGKLASVQKIGESAQAFSDALDRTGKSLTLANQWEKLHATAGGNGSAFSTVLGIIGHTIGGPVGGVAGLALGKIGKAFTNPADTLMQLSRIQQMARQSDSRILKSLGGFARDSKQAATSPQLSSYARKAAEITRMASDPDALATRIGQNLGELRSRAPKLADAMTETALSGMALLRDKLPPPLPGDPLNPHAKPQQPPPAQREQWLRYYHAVKDPDGVVEDLRNGRLSVEGVEVLQQVYPEKYASIQRATFEQMAEGKLKNLTHQQRIGLGLMLQVPSDPTLAPDYIAARQLAFQAVDSAAAQQEAKPRSGKPVNLSKSSPTTAVERLEQGPPGPAGT